MINYHKITLDHLLKLIFASAAFALLVAYISQYFFKLEPCTLCLYERWPFFIILATTILAKILIAYFKTSTTAILTIKKRLFFISIAALIANCALSFYHVGVEKKIFEEPHSCSSTSLNQYDNIDDLQNAIANTKAIRCGNPTYILPFISMAMLNFIYCLALTIICIIAYNKNDKRA